MGFLIATRGFRRQETEWAGPAGVERPGWRRQDAHCVQGATIVGLLPTRPEPGTHEVKGAHAGDDAEKGASPAVSVTIATTRLARVTGNMAALQVVMMVTTGHHIAGGILMNCVPTRSTSSVKSSLNEMMRIASREMKRFYELIRNVGYLTDILAGTDETTDFISFDQTGAENPSCADDLECNAGGTVGLSAE